MKPIMLLDIDGVLNAISVKPPTHAWPKEEWRRQRVDGFQIMAAKSVIDYLTKLSDRVEIRWHTTWQDRALHVGQQFGLPVFGVQEAPEFHEQGLSLLEGAWWKLPVVQRLMEQDHTVIWADDDIDDGLTREQRDALDIHPELLRLCPDHRTGLVRRHLDLIDRFLERRGI